MADVEAGLVDERGNILKPEDPRTTEPAVPSLERAKENAKENAQLGPITIDPTPATATTAPPPAGETISEVPEDKG